MKNIIYVFSFLVISSAMVSYAQPPSSSPVSFLWGQSAGGTDWDNNFRVITDQAGNVYTLGFTYSPVFNYNTDNSTNDDISSNTGSSVYLIKYSPSGNLLWKRIYNANASDERLDLALRNNRIVLSAGFAGTVTFGDSTFTTANSGNSYSLVLMCLDLNGNFNWAKQLDVGLAEFGSVDLAIDAGGEVYFTTAFEGSISAAGNLYNSSGTGNDILYGKMNSTGDLLWINQIGNSEDDKSGVVVQDNNGDLLLSGRFTGTLTIGNNTLNNPVGYDWFLAKLNSGTGTPLWVISEGGLGSDDRISAVGVNPWNEIILTGRFAGSFLFGNQNISSVGNDDIFIAKYSSSGSFIWVKTFGTTGENDWTSNNVGIDDAGTIWLESSVGGDNNGQNYPVFYGSPGDSLNLSGNQDFVFTRYSNSGELLSMNAFGTEAYEFTQDYYFDKATCRSYIAGHHTADTTLFNQNLLTVRGGFADGFTAVVQPNIYAKNDTYSVNNTSAQMIMVLQNDGFTNSPVLSIIEGALHGNAMVMGGNHIAYTASGNFTGTDTIRYRICENNECAEALLIVSHNFINGVSETAESASIALYPNPAASHLFITSSDLNDCFITVTDMLGKRMLQTESKSGTEVIDIKDWPTGIYSVSVYMKGEFSGCSLQFIKQ
jgi:hypothetical protein